MSDTDWSLLEDPEVLAIIDSSARSVIRQWGTYVTEDDLKQEAYLNLAEKTKAARDALSKGYGLLHSFIWCDMVDYARAQSRRAQKISYEALVLEYFPSESG